MGFRFRKSIKILPGLRLNLSRSGVSANIGVRGASVSVGKRGTFVNASIPGTGVSYRNRIGGTETSDRETQVAIEPQQSGSSVRLRMLIIIAIIVMIAIVAGSK